MNESEHSVYMNGKQKDRVDVCIYVTSFFNLTKCLHVLSIGLEKK